MVGVGALPAGAGAPGVVGVEPARRRPRAGPVALPRLGPATRWSKALQLCALILCFLVLARGATAHPAYPSSLSLDWELNAVELTARLPLDQLAMARQQPVPEPPLSNAERASLGTYLRDHVSAVDQQGNPLQVEVRQLSAVEVDGVPHLQATIRLQASSTTVLICARPSLSCDLAAMSAGPPIAWAQRRPRGFR